LFLIKLVLERMERINRFPFVFQHRQCFGHVSGINFYLSIPELARSMAKDHRSGLVLLSGHSETKSFNNADQARYRLRFLSAVLRKWRSISVGLRRRLQHTLDAEILTGLPDRGEIDLKCLRSGLTCCFQGADGPAHMQICRRGQLNRDACSSLSLSPQALHRIHQFPKFDAI
jgi:hypothetical protein